MRHDELEAPEVEMTEVEEGWKLIAYMLSNKHPNPLPQFVSQFSELMSDAIH